MQNVIKVNLAPHTDFADLMQNGRPDFSIVEKVRVKLKDINHRMDLKQACYGDGIDLCDDNVMESNSEGAVFARKMVKELSNFVKFLNSEQKILTSFDIDGSIYRLLMFGCPGAVQENYKFCSE